jgi:hypothetical protein
MTETVRAGRWADGTDETTGDPVRTLVTLRYGGVARVKYADQQVAVSEDAGQLVAAQRIVLSIPTAAPALFEGDEVLVDASTADSLLVGRSYRIDGRPAAGQTTAHRYPVSELS